MPQIQNVEAVNIIRDQAMLAIADGFPQTLQNTVVPVMDMTPSNHYLTQVKSNLTSSNTATIHTTDANKKTLLFGFTFSISKDATSDAATGSATISAVLAGVNTPICRIPYITTTSERQIVSVILQNPILVDKNSAITVSRGSSTVGTFRMDSVIYYTEI